jgi:hypothetical protein
MISTTLQLGKGIAMGFAKTEREWAERAARYLKAELKRADVTYEELAERLEAHGFAETKASISNKLARATVPASFFLACLAVLELDGLEIEDI